MFVGYFLYHGVYIDDRLARHSGLIGNVHLELLYHGASDAATYIDKVATRVAADSSLHLSFFGYPLTWATLVAASRHIPVRS